MIAEDLEFQISQYVDGTLSAAEMKSVEALVLSDDEARKVLADYRRMNQDLATLRCGTQVRWDRFAGQISSEIENLARPAAGVAGRIGFLPAVLSSSRWRIAAAVLITATGAIVAKHAMRPAPVSVPAAAPSVSMVTGPQAEVPTGPAAVEVSVGPSPALAARDSRYGEGVIGQGAPKVILGEIPKSAADPRLH